MRLSMPKLDWKRAAVEFIVIAGGVFAGLAVDGWQEGRRNRAAEAAHLIDLRRDLELDMTEFEITLASIGASERAVGGIGNAITARPLGLPDTLQLPIAVELAGWLYLPVVSSYTYDEMLSTGDLRLLRNRMLKRQLSTYYSLTRANSQWNEDLRRWRRPYQDRIGSILDVDTRVAIETNCCDPRVPLDASFLNGTAVTPVIARLRAIPELPAMLGEVRYALARQSWTTEQLRDQAVLVIGILDREIEARGLENPIRPATEES